jgi:hypothetical protein
MVLFVALPSAPPGISPTGGEIGWAKSLAPMSIVCRRPGYVSISPLVGAMSGRTEGGSPATNGASRQ